MPSTLSIGRALLIALSAVALCGGAARADIIYTITETGTIANGTSQGIFGAAGSSLAGQTFSVTQTFDATLSTYNGNTAANYLSPATGAAIVTVGNNTYSIVSNSNANNEDFISSRAAGYYYDEVYTRTYSNAASYAGYVYSFGPNFLTSDSLSQALVYAIPSSVSSYASFTGADFTNFSGTLNAISINSQVASSQPSQPAVPEPASVAVFGMGLAGWGWLRRRRVR